MYIKLNGFSCGVRVLNSQTMEKVDVNSDSIRVKFCYTRQQLDPVKKCDEQVKDAWTEVEKERKKANEAMQDA